MSIIFQLNQMARMKAAGINPNTAAQGISQGGNESAQAPSVASNRMVLLMVLVKLLLLVVLVLCLLLLLFKLLKRRLYVQYIASSLTLLTFKRNGLAS